jgi:hypothetical protein
VGPKRRVLAAQEIAVFWRLHRHLKSNYNPK